MKKKLHFLFLFFPVFLMAQNLLIYDGEIASSCAHSYGTLVNTNVHSGTGAFEGLPSLWHSPGIRLNCVTGSPAWRANISNYDELWFYAKAEVPNKTLTISFYGWPYASKGVNINNYIVGGGGLTTTYKLVKIPIDSFKTAQYSLGAIEIMYLGTSQPPSGYRIYVDDIWAMDLKPTQVIDTKWLSNTTVKLQVKDKYDTTAVKNLANYQVVSTTDSDFFTPQNATNVGMHYYVEDYDPADNYNNPIPRINYYLYTKFPFTLKNGHTYSLIVNNVRDAAGNDFLAPQTQTFIYQDSTYINGSVKANHVGYLPTFSKYGYVGNWLGSAGALDINTAPIFHIKDAQTGVTVFSGTAKHRKARASSSCNPVQDTLIDARWSGENVYSCDFSTFTTAGKYYLYVPNYGRSYPFSIGTNAYDSAYYHVVRGLYYQRCGMALNPPYADSRWAHGACHSSDAVIHSSCANTSLYNNEPLNDTIPMPGGWHDAGDYGKYIPSVTELLHILFTAYELYPQKFPDGFNNIPESGNGVPDILDEAKWEIDWLKEMQAPDGGVYFKVTTTGWPNSMPQNDLATRWLAEKTTFTTAHFAALMAASARYFQPYFPIYADTCLVRAKRAWDFLVLHPNPVPANGFDNQPGIGGGEYGDPLGDIDERAWAAAELYKTTGDTAYHSAFVYYWTQNQVNFGWNTFQHHQLKASYTYCFTTAYPTNATYKQQFKNARQNGIQNYEIPRINESPYRCSYRSEVIPWIAWGSFGQSSTYAWEMIKASFLLNQNYDNAAAINLDAQLGNNPLNRSLITGVGFDYPMDPLQHPSQADGVVEPVPGLPVFGPHDYLGYAGYAGATQNPKNLYPRGNQSCSAYPTLRRYYDVFENVAMSEFGVESIGRAAMALAYFSSVIAPPTPLPVHFLSLEGKLESNKIHLSWNVAQETNVKGYFVERETGNGFENIGFVDALGQNSYDFDVNQYHLGNNRFRIRQIDFDGKFSYSQVAIVKVENTENVMNVYPNPAKETLFIAWEGVPTSCELSLVDMTGKETPLAHKSLTNPLLTIDISHFAAGIYTLRCVYESGKVVVKKVVVI